MVTWNAPFESVPASSDSPSQAPTVFNNFKTAVRERMIKEHYFGTVSGVSEDAYNFGDHLPGSARAWLASSDPTKEPNGADNLSLRPSRHGGRLFVKHDGSFGETRMYYYDGVSQFRHIPYNKISIGGSAPSGSLAYDLWIDNTKSFLGKTTSVIKVYDGSAWSSSAVISDGYNMEMGSGTYANRPTTTASGASLGSSNSGLLYLFTDATVTTGDITAGSGSNKVIGKWDGTKWTVVAWIQNPVTALTTKYCEQLSLDGNTTGGTVFSAVDVSSLATGTYLASGILDASAGTHSGNNVITKIEKVSASQYNIHMYNPTDKDCPVLTATSGDTGKLSAQGFAVTSDNIRLVFSYNYLVVS